MEKTILFFCDINGTIEGKFHNKEEEYLKFNNILNTISNYNDNCRILFSLVSTENEDVVEQYFNIMRDHLDGSVSFGKQFYEDGYLTMDGCTKSFKGKSHQIINYIEEVSNNSNLTRVYYVDDSEFSHELITECVKIDHYNLPVNSIIPRDCLGLSEVNVLLEKDLNLSKRSSCHL